MKKRMILIAAVGMLLAIAAIGSLSYFQSKDKKVNQFTVDSNESEIIEEYVPPDGLEEGTVISKKVQVKNSGDTPCYVRVLVLPASSPDSFRLETGDVVDSNMESDKLWYHEEGWENYYYYKEVLEPGDTTEPLFTEVTVLEDLTSLEADDAQIIVYEESSQSEGFQNCIEAFSKGGEKDE